ncbi:hypothetical protein [Mucilaginibacter defluvii]|uniref:DKNYY family protein n=1 Tax=Mucilaginibacter defluvii TaxID=1196019 RepID=A0ABP9G557_9SPHI
MKIKTLLVTIGLLVSCIGAFAAQGDSTNVKRRFFVKDYEPGYIILVDNSVKTGLVKFNGDVSFKDKKESDRTKYSPKQLKGFVIGRDTFCVAQNLAYRAQGIWGDSFTKGITYVKQLEYGPVCLYEMQTNVANAPASFGGFSTYSSYMKSNYYVKRKDDGEYTLVSENKKKFKLGMSLFFQDDPSLSYKIGEGELKHDDIVNIVRQYNQQHAAGITKVN